MQISKTYENLLLLHQKILPHLKNFLCDKKSYLVFLGEQTFITLGGSGNDHYK